MSTTPTLKISREVTHRIDWGDLERFVAEEYGHGDFSFQADQCGQANDSVVEFRVSADPLATWDVQALTTFVAAGPSATQEYMTGIILNSLCVQGRIDPGQYLVEIAY